VGHGIVNLLAVHEPDLSFGGMDVHIHPVQGQDQGEEDDGVTAPGMRVFVGLGDGVLEDPVADETAVLSVN
jgi:hypothetical protein